MKLEGDSYPTLSIAYPLLHNLLKKVHNFDTSQMPAKMETYKKSVHSQLLTRFNTIGVKGKFAMILDPRINHSEIFSVRFWADIE